MDNEGLRLAQENKVLIRVIRGMAKNQRGFVFEGVFRVLEHKREKSKDGFVFVFVFFFPFLFCFFF